MMIQKRPSSIIPIQKHSPTALVEDVHANRIHTLTIAIPIHPLPINLLQIFNRRSPRSPPSNRQNLTDPFRLLFFSRPLSLFPTRIKPIEISRALSCIVPTGRDKRGCSLHPASMIMQEPHTRRVAKVEYIDVDGADLRPRGRSHYPSFVAGSQHGYEMGNVLGRPTAAVAAAASRLTCCSCKALTVLDHQ